MGIADVGLASRYVLDVTGVDDERTDVDRLERRVRALSVDARAFHHHLVGLEAGGPRGQLAPVALETAELALFDPDCSVRFLDECAGRDLSLMHIEADYAFVHRHQFVSNGMDAPTRNDIDCAKVVALFDHLTGGRRHHEDYNNRHRFGQVRFPGAWR